MTSPNDPQATITAIRGGNRLALAKAISLLEEGGPAAQQLISAIPALEAKSYSLGITGAPGVGKSTLVNALINTLRTAKQRVAVLATDPTSPFSGGAILGDRIRMLDHAEDKAVFIRSLGSRGNPDGLSTAIPYIMQLLELYGTDYCILETVGSGQLDIMVKAFVDTTLLLISPEAGDEIQMMKAGILEIADIIVINKADRKGVEQIATQLQTWLDLLPKERPWKPPIVRIQANQSIGIDKVLELVALHRQNISQRPLDERELEHRRFMIMTLAVALFRRDCRSILETGKLDEKLRQQHNNPVEIATELVHLFMKGRSV